MRREQQTISPVSAQDTHTPPELSRNSASSPQIYAQWHYELVRVGGWTVLCNFAACSSSGINFEVLISQDLRVCTVVNLADTLGGDSIHSDRAPTVHCMRGSPHRQGNIVSVGLRSHSYKNPGTPFHCQLSPPTPEAHIKSTYLGSKLQGDWRVSISVSVSCCISHWNLGMNVCAVNCAKTILEEWEEFGVICYLRWKSSVFIG